MLHKNREYERDFVKLMISKGYHCERVAGSGCGVNSVCDCVLFKDGVVYLVEVKATKHKEFQMRKNVREQLEKMKHVADKHGLKAMLAVKFKWRGWDVRVL